MKDCKISDSCESTNVAHKKYKENHCCGNLADNIKILADKAWSEMLKEKIKKQYEDRMGEKMDEIAKVAADAAIECWKHKIEAKKSVEEHDSKLQSVLRK